MPRIPVLELIRLPRNAGFAAASNVGFRLASDCDWIASLNPGAFVALGGFSNSFFGKHGWRFF